MPGTYPTDGPRRRAATKDGTAKDDSAVAEDRKTPPEQPRRIGSDGGQTLRKLRAENALRAAMDRAAEVQRLAEALPDELQSMLLRCDTPTAVVALAVSLANTLSVMELLVDDLCAYGLLTIDQIPVTPRSGQHGETAPRS